MSKSFADEYYLPLSIGSLKNPKTKQIGPKFIKFGKGGNFVLSIDYSKIPNEEKQEFTINAYGKSKLIIPLNDDLIQILTDLNFAISQKVPNWIDKSLKYEIRSPAFDGSISLSLKKNFKINGRKSNSLEEALNLFAKNVVKTLKFNVSLYIRPEDETNLSIGYFYEIIELII